MDKRGIALLMISIVFAVAAGGGVYLYLEGMPVAEAKVPETVSVVVARQDIRFGTTLGTEHLRVAEFPKDAVPAGSFPSVDSVLAQTTKVFVVEGEAMLASKLSAIGGGLSVRIPENMRAMSLKINEVTGVSGFVLPGDRVDVVVTVDNVSGTNVAHTKTILQDLEVLAAGVKTETKNNHHIKVQTVTVLVDPEGTEKLALATHQGRVHLSLRNPVDHVVVDATSTDTRSVLGLNKPRTSRRRSTSKKTIATNKDPVPVDPTFTVIRDGRIQKQEPVSTASTESSKPN